MLKSFKDICKELSKRMGVEPVDGSVGYRGFSRLDGLLGINNGKGNLVAVAARPGMGKNLFGVDVMLGGGRDSRFSEGRMVIFSGGMNAEQYGDVMLRKLCGVESELIKAYKDVLAGLERCAATALGYMSSLQLYVDDEKDLTLPHVEQTLSSLGEVSLVLVESDVISPFKASETDEAQVLEKWRGLWHIARKYNATVIALTGAKRALEGRRDKRPRMGDIREACGVRKYCDSAVLLYREAYYSMEKDAVDDGSAELIVAKNRHGVKKSLRAHFDVRTLRFT